MNRAVRAEHKWWSASIFLERGLDVFLYRYLAPFLAVAKRRRDLKRYFFIRYSEGGQHIRVRILPRPSLNGDEIKGWLSGTLRLFQQETGSESNGRIDETVYDRTEAYFGETAASVYSELINEYTSALSGSLFSNSALTRTQVVAVMACALGFFLRSSAEPVKTRAALMQSRRFALDILHQARWRPAEINAETKLQFERIVRRIMPRVRTMLLDDPAAKQIVRLLRRVTRLGGSGEFVATHSLHLFCNKNGILPPEEHHLLEALDEHL